MKAYFLSIVSVALIAAIVYKLVGATGVTAAIVKLISGIILTLTVISPMANFNFSGMTDFMDAYKYDAQEAVDLGKQISADALRSSIIEKTRAYILDKAAEYDTDLEIEIQVTEDPIPKPCSVTIKGNISPYAKNTLQNLIQSDIGIDKEHQIWK